MEQFSKIFPIFAAPVVKNWRHRGELLCFNPSENLENSCSMGKGLRGCSSCSSIYTVYSFVESAYIYTCRCELIFILYATGIPEPSDKECQEGSHSFNLLEIMMCNIKKNT